MNKIIDTVLNIIYPRRCAVCHRILADQKSLCCPECRDVFQVINNDYCMKCGKPYGLAAVLGTQGIPKCACGGVIKPEVVLYEEMLDEAVLQASVRAIAGADLLIIGGTSLNVYPAAGLLRYYDGRELVVINKTPTPADRNATLVLTGAIGEIFAEEPAP